MELLSSIAEIIRDLLIFVAVMTALLIALIIVVATSDHGLRKKVAA